MNWLSHLRLARPERLAGLKLVFAKVALDLPFPVPGGAGVDATASRGPEIRAVVRRARKIVPVNSEPQAEWLIKMTARPGRLALAGMFVGMDMGSCEQLLDEDIQPAHRDLGSLMTAWQCPYPWRAAPVYEQSRGVF